MTKSYQYVLALEDFQRARQRAALEQLVAKMKGKSDQLLSYDDVRKQLKGIESSTRKLEDIPLDAIIGSVGRYNDFTRRFLPKDEVSPSRWAGVMAATGSNQGLPPIEAFKIGDGYFVKDGNHRVSVARQMGLSSIQGYVTEIKTKVPLSPNDDPDSLILKAEYADFLDKTNLDKVRPNVNLQLTAPGNYPLLEEHIRVHQYYLGLEQQRNIAYADAVVSFIDQVYLPTVEIIHSSGLLENFPNRTDADLYLWLTEHRSNLENALDMQVSTTHAAFDLAKLSLPIVDKIVSQVSNAAKKVILPKELDSGPPLGSWRQNIADRLPQQRLFKNMLVPIDGSPTGWYALEQSFIIARRESSSINGLHVNPENKDTSTTDLDELRKSFESKCQQAGVSGSLSIQTGVVAEQIAKRTQWSDLLVVNLSYPPTGNPLARLASSIRQIVRQSFTPVLMVPRRVSALEHALLAYDGSLASQEALYLAAYFAGAWQIKLTVLTVVKNHEEADLLLNQAREYLEMRSVSAELIHKHGNVASDILETATENNCDWLLTGSYGLSPVLEIFWGSTLDTLLQSSQIPVLISR